MNRIVMHIDLDYFYAQLEELRNPDLKGKAVIVCMFSGRSADSGAVASANYFARDLGVGAGMAIVFAKKHAPHGVFLKADREYYEEVSERIMEIFRGFSDKFEQHSIDEASIEISQKCSGSYIEAKKIALEIKKKLYEEEKLTCSIGIGPNKLIAKMSAGTKKPDGITVVCEQEVKDFLRSKRISDLHGIGEKTSEALFEKGIKTIQQLAQTDVSVLQEMFGGKRAVSIHEKSLGIDNSPVEEKIAQQFSRIVTLKENSSDPSLLEEQSKPLAKFLAQKAKESNVYFKSISIILISDKLKSITRSRTLDIAVQKEEEIINTAGELFREFFSLNKDFIARRFGLKVSNFQEGKKQKSIFEF